MAQTKFVLECSECKSHGYVTSKNRQNVQEKLKLSKYCKGCRKHTDHNETRLRK